MVWSIRKTLGLVAFLALGTIFVLAGWLRHEDFARAASPSRWPSVALCAALMGSWGLISLKVSGALENRTLRLLALLLAIAYFGLAGYVTFDAIRFGNSTAALVFLVFPIYATVIMAPALVLLYVINARLMRRLSQSDD